MINYKKKKRRGKERKERKEGEEKRRKRKEKREGKKRKVKSRGNKHKAFFPFLSLFHLHTTLLASLYYKPASRCTSMPVVLAATQPALLPRSMYCKPTSP